MSKKFYAVNKYTGEKWVPQYGRHQYLVLYDSGKLAVVTENHYCYVEPLSNMYELRIKNGNGTTRDKI